MLRGIYLALALVFSRARYDVFFVDQLSIYVPILRLTGSRVRPLGILRSLAHLLMK